VMSARIRSLRRSGRKALGLRPARDPEDLPRAAE
jgi:hypothetical protein